MNTQNLKYYIKYIALFLVILGWVACEQPQQKSVKLKGQLTNFDKVSKLESYDPLDHIVKGGVMIETDEQGTFEITFELEHPKYFRLGRNFLYLSPGDELEMNLDKSDPRRAEFKGEGAQACDYLKYKPFPKGGSYLEAGRVLKDIGVDIKDIKTSFEKIEKEYFNRLASYSDLPQEFVDLEKVRIILNTANSYKMVPSYAFRYFEGKYPDYKSCSEALRPQYMNEVKQKLASISLDPNYLQLEEFVGLIYTFSELYGEMNVPDEIKDFSVTYGLISNLSSNGPTQKFLDYKGKKFPSIKNQKYIDLVNQSMKAFQFLLPGNKAPELSFTDLNGQLKSLSDFRGKILLIDIWATWCGPCVGEVPYYEGLFEKYGDRMQFISISIDDNRNKWKNFVKKHNSEIPQFVTMRSNFEAYHLAGVPRFILIDKDGCILDAWAPKPSSGGLEELIQKNLN